MDLSWILVFGLITFSQSNFFAQQHPHWTGPQHWALGVVTSILFFSSVVFHELAHSVIAQHYKIKVLSITLFLFGGLARIARDPAQALQEFNIAIAGPLASAFLAGVFYGVTLLFPTSEMLGAVATQLALTNGMLAVFNLLPGFPLDGGRVFRAMVWGATKDFARATRVAGASGKLIAFGLISLGVWSALRSDWVTALWTGFLGWFLLNAAQASVAQVTIQETLSGLCASDVMNQEVPIIPANMSLEEYSGEVLRTGRRVHLVTMDDRLVGLMNVSALSHVPREEWNMNSVQAVMVPREKILWAAPEEPLQRLLERLIAADVNQMPVVTQVEEGAHIVGMVTREAILRVIQTRSELEAALTSR
ncbi:MAG: site-2 protease family protein [Candidatus Acidiferrum sp.]